MVHVRHSDNNKLNAAVTKSYPRHMCNKRMWPVLPRMQAVSVKCIAGPLLACQQSENIQEHNQHQYNTWVHGFPERRYQGFYVNCFSLRNLENFRDKKISKTLRANTLPLCVLSLCTVFFDTAEILLQENDMQWKIYGFSHSNTLSRSANKSDVKSDRNFHEICNLFTQSTISSFPLHIIFHMCNACFYPQTNTIIAIRLPSKQNINFFQQREDRKKKLVIVNIKNPVYVLGQRLSEWNDFVFIKIECRHET